MIRGNVSKFPSPKETETGNTQKKGEISDRKLETEKHQRLQFLRI